VTFVVLLMHKFVDIVQVQSCKEKIQNKTFNTELKV